MSDYCTRSDIEAVFGRTNVAKWADLDNDGTNAKIDARIAVAIEAATREVNNRLRGGVYAVPVLGDDGTIREIAATLAGCWLYDIRGYQDYNPETGAPEHRYAPIRRRAEADLAAIRTGQLVVSLNPALLGSRTACPVIVKGA